LTITVGPSDASGTLKLKLGEAAHIRAARENEARFDPAMTDVQRADFSNGIWLCANCHAIVDKNKGADYPPAVLESWRAEHAKTIRALLDSHRSPLAYLRRTSEEGRIAQNIVDVAEQHAALFRGYFEENPGHVVESVDQLRRRFNSMVKEIHYDLALKAVLQQLTDHLRDYMNITSQHSEWILPELEPLRKRVGVQLRTLREGYGCRIPPNISRIVPD
jgi:hypothetical protein